MSNGVHRILPLVIFMTAASFAKDLDIRINEIHYNPFFSGSDPTREFVELFNRGPTDVSLDGWELRQGVSFVFPEGTTIRGRSYLVVSPAPDVAAGAFGLTDVAGPFEGRLGNGGDIVELVNGAGWTVDRVHYFDEGVWPTLADGLGPSLEFTGSGEPLDTSNNSQGHNWMASRVLDGTPGRENSRRVNPAVWRGTQRTTLVEESATWRTFQGRAEPSAEPLDWTKIAYDDSGWDLLPGGFGFGDEHGFTFASQLEDMWFSYGTFYVRGRFDLEASTRAAILAGEKTLKLRVKYDDGFVAYVDGLEVGRDNVGIAGEPVPHDASAHSNRTGVGDVILDHVVDSLNTGVNVVAVGEASKTVRKGNRARVEDVDDRLGVGRYEHVLGGSRIDIDGRLIVSDDSMGKR